MVIKSDKEVYNIIQNSSENEFIDWAIENNYNLGPDNDLTQQKYLYSKAIEQKKHLESEINYHPNLKPALDISDSIVVEFNKIISIRNEDDKKRLMYMILYKYVKLRDMLVDCGLGSNTNP